MTTILDKIIAHKKIEVENQKKVVSLREMEQKERVRKSYSLKKNLLKPGSGGIIAEFKRKSPSKDWINKTADSSIVVPGYEEAGASGSSILTDFNFFGGIQSDLTQAAEIVQLPILRKDFIIDEYQIIEAFNMGADVILLIAACLSPERVNELARLASSLNMEVLLEIHKQEELKHICQHVTMVGVNNRDLRSFTTRLETSVELARLIPDSFVKISESGIKTTDHINYLKGKGFKGFLIGESFMKTDNPGLACKKFIEQL